VSRKSTFAIRSDESGFLYFTDHTAMTTFISFRPKNSTIRDNIQRNITFVLYISHGYNYLHFSCVQKFDFRDSFRRFGIIVQNRSLGLNKLHFCCVQTIDISWFVSTNLYYYTVQITQLREASFLLFPLFRPFMVLSDDTWTLYCTDHTALTTFISNVSRNLPFRDSFRWIEIIVLYRSYGYDNLYFSSSKKFEFHDLFQRIIAIVV
jgi:hypothetical protein